MLALLTRQRDMLKTERFFNTFREYVVVFYIWLEEVTFKNGDVILAGTLVIPAAKIKAKASRYRVYAWWWPGIKGAGSAKGSSIG